MDTKKIITLFKSKNALSLYYKYKKSLINLSLYEDYNKGTTIRGLGFKDKEKAKHTLNMIKNKSPVYKKSVINTMIGRAKNHPYQTKEMREAIKIFSAEYKKIHN